MRWIALFGEAEKGSFEGGVEIHTPFELLHLFGHPPKEAKGLTLAIQALHYNHPLLFFRVKDEGFSVSDYREGIDWMEEKWVKSSLPLGAIFAPGVGSLDILDPLFEFSLRARALLLTTERDFFDFLLLPKDS